MKERPILFNSEMVRAILDGRKTQTRRIVKPQDYIYAEPEDGVAPGRLMSAHNPYGPVYAELGCPFGIPGDRLWVRENFTYCNHEYVKIYKDEKWRGMPDRDTAEMRYEATEVATEIYKWRPSIHMPRWASRITLEITNVRVERIQDGGDREFWGEETWKQNPWVWVIEFKRVAN